MTDPIDELDDRSKAILRAMKTLVSAVGGMELGEGHRADTAEFLIEIKLTGGAVETWKITVERTAKEKES